MSTITGVSLVAFSNPDEIDSFIEAVEIEKLPPPAFELSYKLKAEELPPLRRLSQRVVSSHAPCPWTEVYPNLGSRDPEVLSESFAAIRQSAEAAAEFGASVLVLHPGYATDERVYADYRRRAEVFERLAETQQEDIWIAKGAICRPEYLASPAYRRHHEETIKNLEHAVVMCRELGLELAVENLNPRMTYLFQLPSELLEAVRAVDGLSVCLDLGHLWISSIVYGFDYLDAITQTASCGHLVTTHIHNNESTIHGEIVLEDDHRPLTSGKAPIGEAVGRLRKAGVERYMIESVSKPLENYRALLGMLEASGA